METTRMASNPYYEPMSSAERRVQYEYQIALDSIIPNLKAWNVNVRGKRVLDLGCGDGGLSVALAESGARCLGIDHNEQRIAEAVNLASNHKVSATFMAADVLQMHQFAERFDLIVLSEVVEHLLDWSNVEALLRWCGNHLTPQGVVYVSFPPWFSPFAGHQAGWPVIRYLPWYHLLPQRIKHLLVPTHAPRYLDFFRELNHITIGGFERIVTRSGLEIAQRDLYHLRPEFRWRYGVPVIRAVPMLAKMAGVREIVSTGAYYLLTRS